MWRGCSPWVYWWVGNWGENCPDWFYIIKGMGTYGILTYRDIDQVTESHVPHGYVQEMMTEIKKIWCDRHWYLIHFIHVLFFNFASSQNFQSFSHCLPSKAASLWHWTSNFLGTLAIGEHSCFISKVNIFQVWGSWHTPFEKHIFARTWYQSPPSMNKFKVG